MNSLNFSFFLTSNQADPRRPFVTAHHVGEILGWGVPERAYRGWTLNEDFGSMHKTERLGIQAELDPDAFADGILQYSISADGTMEMLYANAALFTSLGYSLAELKRVGLMQCIDVEDRERVMEHICSGKLGIIEFTAVRKDKTTFRVEANSSLARNGDPNARNVVLRDLTTLENTKDQLRSVIAELRGAEEKFRILAENAFVGTYEIDETYHFGYVNPALCQITGYTPEELSKIYFWEIFHPDDQSLVRDRGISRLGGESVPSGYEVRIVNKQGEIRTCELRASLVIEQGKPVLVGNLSDVTEDRALQKATSTYIAMTSHELRNPAQILDGLSGVVLEKVVDLSMLLGELEIPLAKLRESLENSGSEEAIQILTEIMEYIAIILQSPGQIEADLSQLRTCAQDLVETIGAILLISKIEAGKAKMEDHEMPIYITLQECCNLHGIKAQKKGIQIVCEAEENIKEFETLIDMRFFKLIVNNLLSNAIKFSREGGEIRIYLSFICGEKDSFRLVVEDQGAGISPEGQNRLFIAYAQADENVGKVYGGTGLGLHIAQHAAEMMGGKLKLDRSEEGIGSTFSVTLPIKMRHGETKNISSTVGGGNQEYCNVVRPERVLVIEDATVICKLMSAMLHKNGLGADYAVNDTSALEALKKTAYDLVLIDLHLAQSVNNGLDLIEMIRGSDGLGWQTPSNVVIIANSAAETEEDLGKRSVEIGANIFLQKPITPLELGRVLKRLLPRKEA